MWHSVQGRSPGCLLTPKNIVPKIKEGGLSLFALIVRGGCSFEDKVRRAQIAGFKAAIVFDNEDGDLVASKYLLPVPPLLASSLFLIYIYSVYVLLFVNKELLSLEVRRSMLLQLQLQLTVLTCIRESNLKQGDNICLNNAQTSCVVYKEWKANYAALHCYLVIGRLKFGLIFMTVFLLDSKQRERYFKMTGSLFLSS